jgi:hypothetical protein
MQHKGIEYSVQARPGPNQWTWTIHLGGGRTRRGEMQGTRAMAEERAIRAVNEWCKAKKSLASGDGLR